jgi:hypothetical protein
VCGSDLPNILFDIAVVGVDDVVGQEWHLPRNIILAPLDRLTFHGLEFPCYRDKIDPFLRADCRESNVASATEVDPVVFEDLGGSDCRRR